MTAAIPDPSTLSAAKKRDLTVALMMKFAEAAHRNTGIKIKVRTAKNGDTVFTVPRAK